MSQHPEHHHHHVRRVVLPSGKTIEVVYFEDMEAAQAPPPAPAHPKPTPEPPAALHVCGSCKSELVYPVEWDEAGRDSWWVLLRCPNCERCREGVFAQETVERFDEVLDDGAEQLASDYRRLVRANMADEIDRFAAALHADAILPEDF